MLNLNMKKKREALNFIKLIKPVGAGWETKLDLLDPKTYSCFATLVAFQRLIK